MVEFGCGDGQQLALYDFPEYLGLDVSKTILTSCISQFEDDKTKSFKKYCPESFVLDKLYDLSISIDVLYHLIEQEIFEKHLTDLFEASSRWVVIYSCNFDKSGLAAHVRPRKFTDFVQDNFREFHLVNHTANPYPIEEHGLKNGSWSDFFVYQKQSESQKEQEHQSRC